MAEQLLAQYGDDAVVIAVLNADEEMDCGNVEGFNRWHKIATLIRTIQSERT